jgi:hypothetical protein
LALAPKIQAQQATVASGGKASGTGGSSSYSVGQLVYTTITGTKGYVNQGVQQPFEVFTLGTDSFPEIKVTMSVYPNPTASFVNLKIENHSLDNIQFQLFDIKGRQIQIQKILQSETPIQLENLPVAIYLLNVVEDNKLLKTFKIIKN